MYWGYLNNIKNSEEHFWKILSKQDALSSTETFGSTDLGDLNGVSALGDVDTLNNTLQSLSMYKPGEHSEYEQTESDEGDSLEENIDALYLESIDRIVFAPDPYKECGLMHLLKYTKDTEQDKDWMDLVTISNIETAAKNVKRIAIALHLSFTKAFFKNCLRMKNTSIQIICNIKTVNC
ncbi:unnamed protein product [Mytilus coruscus]|uniref:Uncharacterized protein n=1 Tax=Mytilus coruscus TaxID=42192 RepID=A0A6J8ANX2_MYTCO|nr:unnamed protein product [Mytilus coruscus]